MEEETLPKKWLKGMRGLIVVLVASILFVVLLPIAGPIIFYNQYKDKQWFKS